MSQFESELKEMIKKSKDIMFLISGLEEKRGHRNSYIVDLKNKFLRIQDNIAYAKEHADKGMEKDALQHLCYAKDLMKKLDKDVRNKRGGVEKDISPSLSFISILIIGILVLVLLPYFLQGWDRTSEIESQPIEIITVLSPYEQITSTLNTFTLRNQYVEYDMDVSIKKFGEEFEYLPSYIVHETHKGGLRIDNLRGNQKAVSRLIDYLTVIRIRTVYYSRGGRYTCNERYTNCNPVTLNLIDNRNLYSKLHQIIDRDYALSFSDRKFDDCTEIVISSPLLNRRDVESVFGRVYTDYVSGYYLAEVCLNHVSGEIIHFNERAGYSLQKITGDSLFEHEVTYSRTEG